MAVCYPASQSRAAIKPVVTGDRIGGCILLQCFLPPIPWAPLSFSVPTRGFVRYCSLHPIAIIFRPLSRAFATKNTLASASEPNIKARQGGRRLAPSAGAIALKLGVMRLNYLSPEAQPRGGRQPRGVKRKRYSEHGADFIQRLSSFARYHGLLQRRTPSRA